MYFYRETTKKKNLEEIKIILFPESPVLVSVGNLMYCLPMPNNEKYNIITSAAYALSSGTVGLGFLLLIILWGALISFSASTVLTSLTLLASPLFSTSR